MSARQVIFETEHLQALGNERGLVIVFKGDPAVISNHDICHPALGKVLNVGPGVSVPFVRSVAFLRGRGVFIQYVNPNPHYMTYVTMPAMVGMWANEGMIDDPKPAKYLSLHPHQSKWADGNDIVMSLIRPRAVTTNVTYQQVIHAPNPQALQPVAPEGAVGNAVTYNIAGGSTAIASVHYVPTEVGHAIDAYLAHFNPGYGGTYIRVQPESKDYELNQIMDVMSKRIAPHVPPDQYDTITPMSYNDFAHRLKDVSFRRLMMRGGATDLVEYITGTRSKQMMKMLMPILFKDGSGYQTSQGTGAGQFVITTSVSNSYVQGTYLHTHYFEMRKIMRSMSVDHRIRFMKLYLWHKSLPYNSYANVAYGTALDDLQEFFTLGDHTKILNKIEEGLKQYETMIGMTVSSSARGAMDPFQAMGDTGSQLRRWRTTKLNSRQAKMFPNGIVIKKWQTIKEIHDDISKQANKLESLGQLLHMPWNNLTMPLHGSKCGEVTLLMPRTNQALVRWGKAQGHCVGSMYNQSMQRGDCQIVGAFVGGKVMYCIRLIMNAFGENDANGAYVTGKRWKLAEFRGQGNCWPTVEHAALVLEMLEKAGVDTTGWAESQNGYGRSKSDTWNHDLEQHRETIPFSVITPSVVVRNFTKGLGPESDDFKDIQP